MKFVCICLALLMLVACGDGNDCEPYDIEYMRTEYLCPSGVYRVKICDPYYRYDRYHCEDPWEVQWARHPDCHEEHICASPYDGRYRKYN